MEPAIARGAMFRLRGNTQAPTVGEIVAFWDGKQVVVHRIQGVRASGKHLECRMRGEANRHEVVSELHDETKRVLSSIFTPERQSLFGSSLTP